MTNIIIAKTELSFQMRYRSHLEVASISSEEERYKVEAGSEKTEAINTYLAEADGSLRNLLRRFLTANTAQDSDYTYHLDFSDRRAVNKVPALTESMKSYLIETALTAFYRTVAQVNLSQVHEAKAKADESNIINIINYKSEPTWQD